MFHQIIEVREEGRYLSLGRGFLIIREHDIEIAKIALDDIAVLLVSAQGVSLSKNILVELSERGAITIFCGKNYNPQSIVYPVEGHYHQAGILKLQIKASIPFQKNAWRKIIQAKIQNQAKALKLCGKIKEAKKVALFEAEVKSGDTDNKEGQAARMYWTSLFGDNFIRNRDEEGINALLNYGYAIMRSAMVRSICASGLNPSLGVHHKNALDVFCLADDFFEIYRPLVDCIVYNIAKNSTLELNKETKSLLIKSLWVKMKTTEGTSPAFQSMHYLTSSFVKALKDKNIEFTLPVWEGQYESFSNNE